MLTIKNKKTIETTIPTLAFNIEKLVIKDLEFQIWDAPGQKTLRDVWKSGYERAKILIFVLDTADKMRYKEAREEFFKVLDNPVTWGIPLIFCYHKMDLDEAQENIYEAKKIFNLSSVRGRKIIAYETSIMQLETLTKLESTLVNIILGTMW